MIQINQIGTDFKEDKNFIIHRENGTNDYLLLLFASPVYLLQNNKKTLMPKGTFILLAPNSSHHYYNDESGFDNDWIHFYTNDFDIFINRIILPLDTPFYIKDYMSFRRKIKAIESEILMKAPNYLENVDYMLRSMLISLSRLYNREYISNQYSYDLYTEDKIRQARTNIMSSLDRQWTLEMMAKTTNFSISRFSHLYKNIFGYSPKNDLLEERFSSATYLLKSTELSISQIATRVGYNNQYHFSKQFKLIYKKSPSKYRNS